MASIKVEEEEIEFNSATVKLLTRQVTSYVFENVDAPIFKWRLPHVNSNTNYCTLIKSNLFLINGDFIAHFQLISPRELALNVVYAGGSVQPKKLDKFRFSVMKWKATKVDKNEAVERCCLSKNAFQALPMANDIKLHFPFFGFGVKNVMVELYREPLASIEYLSPYKNTVVGKIERFQEVRKGLKENELLIVSPRFKFGPPDQLAIVRFWYAPLRDFFSDYWNDEGLTATVYLLDQSTTLEPPFSFTVTFTIYSQTETVKDMVHEIFFYREESTNGYSTQLAFYDELRPYMENDTLYYKVDIKPSSFKRPIKL